MSEPYLSLVIPAYNEAHRIGDTLWRVQTYLDDQPYSCEIIVVADGTDGTADIVAGLCRGNSHLHLLSNERRMGKGYAVRSGVARARGEVIGFTDADYKTPIEEIEKMLPWLEQGYDVVIGSRGMKESQIEIPQPLYRQVGSRGFGLVMHALIGLHDVRDTQCGFKFFPHQVARHLFTRQKIDGYMFDIEILYLAECLGYRIKEVPIRWMDDGDSRLQLVSGNWRNFCDLVRIRFGINGATDDPAQSERGDTLS